MKDCPQPGAGYVAGGLAVGAAAALAYWQHYNENVAAPPRLWLADGPLRERVLPHCTALQRPFAPTPWAANRHAQTVLGLMRTLTMRNRYNRQLILTVDGATLGLDWFDGCDSADFPAPPTAPVLLVCHGINGGSHEGYAKWVCAAALAHGWRAAVLNYRGCNGLPFTAPRGYAATMSHDIFTAVYSVKARFPEAPLMAVGYSLGGLKLTKYVAEADLGLHPPPPGQPQLFTGSGLAAAAVVSSPISLSLSAAKLSDPTSSSFLYNLAVAYKLREHIAKHREDIEAHTRFDVDAALSAWTVAGIEDRGLPASLGFADRQQYYEAAGSLEFIPLITTPTLFLLSEDDPFLGIVPDVECSRNPSTLLALTRRGGHVAFLQGAWPLGRSYMDDAVMEFFEATLTHLHGVSRQGASAEEGQDGSGAAAATAGPTGSAPSGTAAGAATREPVVTDAARAGAVAAAMAAAGRRCTERCCGGGAAHHHAVRADESIRAPVPAQSGNAGIGGSAAVAAPSNGGKRHQDSRGTAAAAAAAEVQKLARAADNLAAGQSAGPAMPHGEFMPLGGARAPGVVAGQLQLMLRLQYEAEQRRWANATRAAAVTARSKL